MTYKRDKQPTRIRRFSWWLLPLLVVLTAAFQPPIEPVDETQVDRTARISWPPPVYVLRGEVPIIGTVAMPDMNSYFLEFRALAPDFSVQDETVAWTPLSLPQNTPVIEDELGQWNTTAIADGIYELRLTIQTTDNQVVHARVSPLRVENEPPPFLADVEATTAAPQQATPTSTLPPTPTAPAGPEATARLQANVRAGDSVNYDIIDGLDPGQTVPVIGRSASGSGWWVIRLPDGREGWVAPSVVDVTGNVATLPLLTPPATPTPEATATPNLPDATITNVRFDRPLVQGEAFQVLVTVRNASGVPLPEISVACNFEPMDSFFSTSLAGLGGFQETTVALTAQLNTGGGGNVTADCAVDVNNLVQEISDDNNFRSATAPLATP